MSWLKVSDMELNDDRLVEAGPAVCWFRHRAQLRMAANQSNGWVSDAVVRTLDPEGPAMATRLVELGLWEKARGGYRDPIYQEHNDPEKIAQIRAARREAGRLGGLTRAANAQANASANGQAKSNPSPSQSQSQSPSPSGRDWSDSQLSDVDWANRERSARAFDDDVRRLLDTLGDLKGAPASGRDLKAIEHWLERWPDALENPGSVELARAMRRCAAGHNGQRPPRTFTAFKTFLDGLMRTVDQDRTGDA